MNSKFKKVILGASLFCASLFTLSSLSADEFGLGVGVGGDGFGISVGNDGYYDYQPNSYSNYSPYYNSYYQPGYSGYYIQPNTNYYPNAHYEYYHDGAQTNWQRHHSR